MQGFAAMLAFQTFENIGMCLGLTPVVGLTLPFFRQEARPSSPASRRWALFRAYGCGLSRRKGGGKGRGAA
jgi:hypothetical protein